MSDTKHTLTQDYFRALLENMVAMAQMAPTVGVAATPAQIVSATLPELQDVIHVSFPLAHINQSSDLVVHAEGPALSQASPRLGAFNVLMRTAQASLRLLSAGLFSLLERDAKTFMQLLDLRLTGMAPGSLYLGFAIAPPDDGLLPANDEPVFQAVREAMRKLPAISHCVGPEEVSGEIDELLPDPAQRDNALQALYRLSPSGRSGIASLDLASPGNQRARLSPRERVVLKQAVDRPQLRRQRSGTFVGDLLEIDLTKSRFQIRNVCNVGSLRCVAPPDFNVTHARKALGTQVRVHGFYESDRAGRPRLMTVQSIEAVPAPTQTTI